MTNTPLFRLAAPNDAEAVYTIYRHIMEKEAQGQSYTGWEPGVYPTRRTIAEALDNADLYVAEYGGQIAAAARLNQNQVPVYAQCPWLYPADPDKVLVIHTLVVEPALAGHGLGKKFIAFYEQQAKARGCTTLRLDTGKQNTPARSLYTSLGYREAAILECEFNGLPGTQLVCLEKKL